eukprot:SAG11_NODE_80_length_17731_cov_13.985254_13_plen_103_part_00
MHAATGLSAAGGRVKGPIRSCTNTHFIVRQAFYTDQEAVQNLRDQLPNGGFGMFRYGHALADLQLKQSGADVLAYAYVPSARGRSGYRLHHGGGAPSVRGEA